MESVDEVVTARRLVGDRLAAGSWTRTDSALVVAVADITALRAQVDALLLDAIAEVDARGLANRRGGGWGAGNGGGVFGPGRGHRHRDR